MITILIVEDQPLEARLLEMFLQPIQVNVIISPNFRDAIEQMKRIPPPDLVLLDLRLPDTADYLATLRGIELLREYNPSLVVVAMSGMTVERITEIAREFGADHFHDKRQLDSQSKLLHAIKPHIEKASAIQREAMLDRLGDLLPPSRP